MEPVTFVMPTKGLKNGAILFIGVGIAALVAAPLTHQSGLYFLGGMFVLFGGGAFWMTRALKPPVLVIASDHVMFRDDRWAASEITVGPIERKATHPHVTQDVFEVSFQRPGEAAKNVVPFYQLNWPELTRMHQLLSGLAKR